MTPAENPWGLSERECEVVGNLFALDMDKVIARELGITHRTVEAHMLAVLRKMKAKSRVQAAVLWDRWAREQERQVA